MKDERQPALAYGFDLDDPGQTAAHNDRINYASLYHHAALNYLSENIDWQMSERIPDLTAQEGVWHPSGFMVFRLGQHPVLGALRLHVWPKEGRQREVRGRGRLEEGLYDGDIHDHDWYVDGLNIAGYRDKLFDVEPVRSESHLRDCTEQEIATLGLSRLFYATYLPGNIMKLEAQVLEPNSIHNEHGVVRSLAYVATQTDYRKLEVGEVHSIDPGQFHAPVIPEDEFAATLAFNSPRVIDGGPRILIGGARSQYTRPRQPVAEDEWQAAKESLLNCTL